MTNKEYKRINNFLEEKGHDQHGFLVLSRDKKTKKLYNNRTYVSFKIIKPNDGEFRVLTKSPESDYRSEMWLSINRKHIQKITMRSMVGWSDVKGERDKRLNKILGNES